MQSRGGKGIMAMRLTDKTGLMAAQLLVSEDEDVMLITDDGTIIRMPVSDISVIGRVSQGVRVMRVEEGSRIVCVTATERDEDEQDESEDGQTEADSLDMDVGGKIRNAAGNGRTDEASLFLKLLPSQLRLNRAPTGDSKLSRERAGQSLFFLRKKQRR